MEILVRGFIVGVDMVVDEDSRTVHLLDTDEERSLTNSVEEVIPYLVENVKDIKNSYRWRWILYGTDGVICEYDYSNSEFKLLDPEVVVCKEFVRVIGKKDNHWR